jgi:hypothetical protein
MSLQFKDATLAKICPGWPCVTLKFGDAMGAVVFDDYIPDMPPAGTHYATRLDAARDLATVNGLVWA